MLERNILSHLKLAVLLSLLASSLLLKTRLVPVETERQNNIPLASVEFVGAILCIIAGVWEYQSGFRDLRSARPFLGAIK